MENFIKKLKGELIDIVEWLEDSRSTLVYRFVRHQNEIKNGARLVVREGQAAVFVNEGQTADIFTPVPTRSTRPTCQSSPPCAAGSTASTAPSRPKSTSSAPASSPTSNGAR